MPGCLAGSKRHFCSTPYCTTCNKPCRTLRTFWPTLSCPLSISSYPIIIQLKTGLIFLFLHFVTLAGNPGKLNIISICKKLHVDLGGWPNSKQLRNLLCFSLENFLREGGAGWPESKHISAWVWTFYTVAENGPDKSFLEWPCWQLPRIALTESFLK